jgi:hypothetical protein
MGLCVRRCDGVAAVSAQFAFTPSEQRRIREFADQFARRHGYSDAEAMGGTDPVDVLRDEIEGNPNVLADLFTSGDLYGDPRLGQALVSIVTRDSLHACDLLREVLQPLIEAEVDKRAKHEGVGPYFDLMAVAA